MRQLVLFGGAGFVGGNLAAIAVRRGWRVCVADLSVGFDNGGVEQQRVDITSTDEVDAVIGEHSPCAVVNMAAIANIDLAERERDLAWSVNVEGARNVAESCAERNLRCVLFSSDAVYNGRDKTYTEGDEPAPVNFYGKTKAAAEAAVLAAHPDAVVLRLSLVLGFPVVRGNSFLASLQAKLEAGQEVPCPVDELRTPVDVLTLSECVLELAEGRLAGVFHIGATASIDRYSLSKRLARRMGFGERLIVPLPVGEVRPGRAPRHKNGVLSVKKAQRLLSTEMPDLEHTIDRALADH